MMQHLYEFQHSLRVARLCEALYNDIVPAVNCALLVRAAQLHDIGKLRIDERLLAKTGPLTSKEFACIKEHPARGYDWTMEHTGDRDMARIVAQHHESPDGSGYPAGIVKIQTEAAIIKICDVFDALISNRAYRPGYSPETALILMQKDNGTKFDCNFFLLFQKFIQKGMVVSA